MYIVDLLSKTDVHRSSNTVDAEAFRSRYVAREAIFKGDRVLVPNKLRKKLMESLYCIRQI